MIYIYILYMIISAIILGFMAKKSVKEWFLKIIIVFFVPIIGWFFPIIWSKMLIPNKGETLDSYLKKQNDDIEIELLAKEETIEREKELNIIPIEEALVMSDFTTRRKVMLDVLKKDAMQYIDVIKMAVLNDDSETAHFAVAAVMEVKRKLSLSLQTFSVEFEKDSYHSMIARSYAQVLREYMKSGFLDEKTLKKYKYTYIQVLEQLIDNGEGDQITFEEKMKVEMELHEYANAEKTGLQYLQYFPGIEEPYICLLDYYYTTKSKISMQRVLDELMNSTIQFSNRALTIVRYWSGGQENEI
ncbi:hypothetical protein [Rummeliibacillus suwonensis]|uniref:hypothetical protein n=1 Tax=Rummeliibacillus suwonensis TaxID=1306154 RepID=UPI001AAE1E81|nr:hypothetical protein [Rummeliibacillus suwonensis]MBO2536274.1 hypothetical protein [Rummeliibacillus suwonensis]